MFGRFGPISVPTGRPLEQVVGGSNSGGFALRFAVFLEMNPIYFEGRTVFVPVGRVRWCKFRFRPGGIGVP